MAVRLNLTAYVPVPVVAHITILRKFLSRICPSKSGSFWRMEVHIHIRIFNASLKAFHTVNGVRTSGTYEAILLVW